MLVKPIPKKARALTPEEYSDIRNIALTATRDNKDIDYGTCYSITLLYYLLQFGGLEESEIIPPYHAATLLYKNPVSSYLHYRTEILYSDDIYAKAIKAAEIKLNGGDDPRCPW